ncbi:hypothetical protein Tco_0430978 [Tanacetum coccineum]
MPTPPPSPPISLSPPSAGERLARCMAPSVHSSPPPVPSPLLPSSGCPTQIQTLRIASTSEPLLMWSTDFYALLEDAQDGDSMDCGGGGICFPKGLGSLDRIESGDPSGMQQAEMAALRESDRRHQARMAETLRVMRDMRREMSDMQAELLAHREQQGRAR